MNRSILPIILMLTFLANPNRLDATPVKHAILIKDVNRDIRTPDGRIIGFAKIPSGTTVTVDSESGAELLIHREGELSFKAPKDCVSETTILAVETPTPTPTSTPLSPHSPTSTPETTTSSLLKKIVVTTATTIKTIGTIEEKFTEKKSKNVKQEEDYLKNYYGGALRLFIIKKITENDSYGNSPEETQKAVSQIEQLQIKEGNLPEISIASLNGTQVSNTKNTGAIIVSITKEANHRDHPGFSSSDLNTLKEATSENNDALVEFYAVIAPNTVLRNTLYTAILSNYDPKTDTFLCRKSAWGYALKTSRITSNDLSLGATKLIVATINWRAEAINTEVSKESTDLKNFHYDKTLIIPGNFAFLALPFIKQLPMGICAAASSLNVIKYIDPEINLEQKDLFKTFNNQPAGANLQEIAGGLATMGFSPMIIVKGEESISSIRNKIEASLEDNKPIIVQKPGHFLTIIGYNKSNNTIIAWDQARANNTKRLTNDKGMPQGAYETSIGEFTAFMFVRKTTFSASREEEQFLEKAFGDSWKSKKDLQKHIIVNGNPTRETNDQFYVHALPQAFKLLRSKNRLVIIKNEYGSSVLCINPKDNKDNNDPNTITYTKLPENTTSVTSLYNINRILAKQNGNYYSIQN